jgi:NTP pyrophosphatase (non-canonical NTP hydrolase)
MAAKKRKKSKGSSKSSIGKIGKITFLYFSGDVGEFIDALTTTLKDPKVRSQIGDALTQVGPAIAAAEEATKR